MNKQPSKESLKDKVKGIFGLGPPRPPSKQSESKQSEFIITTDIIKVRRRDLWACSYTQTHHSFDIFFHIMFRIASRSWILIFFVRSSTRIAVWATGFAWWTMYVVLPKQKSLRRWVCDVIFLIQQYMFSSVFVNICMCTCSSACSGGSMESRGGHAVSRAATWGQTCCPTAAEGHYTGTGLWTQHTSKYKMLI